MHPHLCGEDRESPCFPKIQKREVVQPEDSRRFGVFVLYNIRGAKTLSLGCQRLWHGNLPQNYIWKENSAVVDANTLQR